MRCFVLLPAGGIAARCGWLDAPGAVPGTCWALRGARVRRHCGAYGGSWGASGLEGCREEGEVTGGKPGVRIPKAAPEQAVLMSAIKPRSECGGSHRAC